jgi:succinate dehydrogenase (ubiquinone) cytochrome b560 subunit
MLFVAICHQRHGSYSLTPTLSYYSLLWIDSQNYSTRMKKLGRPVSPHVTIYAFPVAALSSITNRVTGCALACGFATLGGVELLMGSGSALGLMQTVGSQGFVIATTAKFAVAFPLAFHYMGAMRHFAWDYKPDLLSNQDAEKTSYYMFGGATAVSGALALFV